MTQLLQEWSEGKREAADEVLPRLYEELHRIAASYFRRERKSHTLQATALVHEAFLRLAGHGVEWRDRAHFIGLMAHVMRRVLVDHARRRDRLKRGGGMETITLAEAAVLATERTPDLMELEDALSRLARHDPRKATLVELRFFGGLTVDEAAEVLGVSAPTVVRQWRQAKAWLYLQLQPGGEEDED